MQKLAQNLRQSLFTVSSKSVALLLASSISLITTTFLSLVPQVPLSAMIVVAGLSFASSFILIYITSEFLIFREIEKVYDNLRENAGTEDEEHELPVSRNPIQKINEEIVNYVSQKEVEIDALKQLEQYRREFIADVSHELRTPIFAAQGYILTLQDGAINDKRVRGRFLKKAAKSLNRLDALVRDLLTLSKMEAGVITMHYTVFDLQSVVLDIFEQLESKAKKRAILLQYPQPHEDGIYVRADAERIGQVLDNLLNNAIAYGREGGWVSVTLHALDHQVKVQVADNGPGIPEEHLNRIFERFYRVEKSRNKKQGGSGLGLAIAKHIVENHDSNLEVESLVNEGTTFSFMLTRVKEESGIKHSEALDNEGEFA
jgi:two-component system phosphate regulon sensor histidine kinase PhoR